MLIDIKPRLVKPPFGSVRVDWGHPLAWGLKHSIALLEGGGTTAFDSLGINNGTLGSAVSWTTSNRGLGITATALDQANAYINLGASTSLNIPASPGASCFLIFSIAGSGGSAHALFSLRDSVNGNPVFDFEVGFDGVDNSGTDKLAVLVRDDGGAGLAHIHGATVLTPNVTYAALLTCQMGGSKALTIYLNGVQDASGTHTMTGAISGNSKRWINESQNSSIQNLRGKVVLGYFWHRELSASEAMWLFAEPYAFLRPIPAVRYAFMRPALAAAAGATPQRTLLGVGV